MPGRLVPGGKKAGILGSWQLGIGIVALQEAKMCTETPKISMSDAKMLIF